MPALRSARAALAALALAALPAGALLTATPALAATPTLEVDSRGSEVVDNAVYGPVQIMRWHFTNTGDVTTGYLDVQLPDGRVFIDDEGEQMLIRCTEWMFPLDPSESADCEAWRLLTDAEIRTGTTVEHSLDVVAFGSDGPRIPVTVPSVATNGVGEQREVTISNPKSEVVLDDPTYGAVEIYTYTFENTGNIRTGTAHLIGPDGNIFVDGEGEEMMGHCTEWMLPLSPGDTATCRFFRLLTPEELANGRTDALELRFELFGTGSDLIAAPSVPSIEFGVPADTDPVETAPTEAAPTPTAPETPAPTEAPAPTGAPTSGAVPSATSIAGTAPAAAPSAGTNADGEQLAHTGGTAATPLAAAAALAAAAGGALVLRHRRA